MVFITLKFQKERIQIDLPNDGKDAVRAISKRVDLPKGRMKIIASGKSLTEENIHQYIKEGATFQIVGSKGDSAFSTKGSKEHYYRIENWLTTFAVNLIQILTIIFAPIINFVKSMFIPEKDVDLKRRRHDIDPYNVPPSNDPDDNSMNHHIDQPFN